MMMSFSDQVNRYLSISQDILILPDNIAHREGVACGDEIELSGELNDSIVSFRMISSGCSLSIAACNYLYVSFSGIPVDQAIDSCRMLYAMAYERPSEYLSFWELPEQFTFLDCLRSPIPVLLDFLLALQESAELSYQRADTSGNLDCDACVSSARINWTGRNENVVPAKSPAVYPTTYYKKWGLSAKAYLSDDEQKRLFNLYSEMTDADLDFLEHEKMLGPVYANFLRCGVNVLHDPRFKRIMYPIHRQYVVKREIAYIEDFIAEESLAAYFVKGARSSKLYDKRQLRLHLDYDIICTVERDAFRLCSFLYRRGFRLFSGVFSLKWIDENGTRTCSGHYHLQKIVNAQFKIIIDVTFPAFPMGRIALFHPIPTGRKLSNEDLLFVAICHTFKHRNVFMKDINDVYMMLKSYSLDYSYLKRRISECGLSEETSLLFSYVFENYDLSEEIKNALIASLGIDTSVLSLYPDWPYNNDSVYRIKRHNLDERLANAADNPRIYLFPIAIFREIINLDTVMQSGHDCLNVERLSSSILSVVYDGIGFYLFPMGLFMDSDYDVSKLGRGKIRVAAEAVLRLLGSPSRYELPYAIWLRDNWYD